jgi:hypothetical protein
MPSHVLRSSFNSGEISPLLDARVDSEKYAFSCRRLENFIPKIYGGAFRRPGTMLVGSGGDESHSIRLAQFIVSARDRYILEFGEGYLKIWNSDGSPFIDKINPPYISAFVAETPYAANELLEVQFAQIGNIAYFTHPDHPPQRLVRSANPTINSNIFTWSEVSWLFPCFRDINPGPITATPAATSGATTIEFSSADPFLMASPWLYNGARIMLSQRRASSHVKIDLTATTNSSSIVILGDFSLFTYGSYTGTLSVQEKDKNGDWQTTRSFQATSDRQIVYTSFTDQATEVRLSYAHTSGTGATAYLEAADSRRVGYARIVDTGQGLPGKPTSGIMFDPFPAVTVSVVVEEAFDSTAETTEWALESWAPYSGYPRSVAFHEQRLWFGGTKLEPSTFWASQTNDFENFRRGAFDSDSLAFTLAAQEGSEIQSLLSHEALVLFTQSEEWTATTSQQTSITPSNIFVRRQSRFGSAHRQSFVANNNIVFLQRGARKLRDFRYTPLGAEGQSTDLTLLAEHISMTGIRQIAFAQQPDPVIWCVLNGGDLIGLTYESDQNVIAWSRHVTSGQFESVAVLYGESGPDEVWVSVRRGDRRLIERLDPDAHQKLEQGSVDSMVYVDSALVMTSPSPQADWQGFTHLEGMQVSILADGAAEPIQVVSGGRITLGRPAQTVVVGLPYVSLLQPSKIEIGMRDGTAQGRSFLCKRASLNLWKTFGLEYSNGPDTPEGAWYPATQRPMNTALGEPSPLFTGMIDVNNLGGHGDSVDFTVRQTLPLPANILAMIPKIEITGS